MVAVIVAVVIAVMRGARQFLPQHDGMTPKVLHLSEIFSPHDHVDHRAPCTFKETHLNSHRVCFLEVHVHSIDCLEIRVAGLSTGRASQPLPNMRSNAHKNLTFSPQLRAPPFATEFATTRGCFSGSSVAPAIIACGAMQLMARVRSS